MIAGIVEPARNVAARVEHAPHVDMVVPLDIEDQPWKAREAAMPQPRESLENTLVDTSGLQ